MRVFLASSAFCAAFLLLPLPTALAQSPPKPFTQCPPIGADTSCAIVYVRYPSDIRALRADHGKTLVHQSAYSELLSLLQIGFEMARAPNRLSHRKRQSDRC